MAKVRKTKVVKTLAKKAKTVDVESMVSNHIGNGWVTVNMGLKASAQFQTIGFDVGVTLPIGEVVGETPVETLGRAHDAAQTFMAERGEETNEVLGRYLQEAYKELDAAARKAKRG